MIIDSTEITKYVAKETLNDKKMVVHFRLHNPTGVYFAMHKDDKTEEVMFFSVAAVNSDAQTEEKRTFASTDEKTFFEAVDYFEKLIADRTEDKQQSPPSTAKFFYVVGKDSFVILATDPEMKSPIYIEKDDVDKCFLPPATKKFGRLDMFGADKPQYDVIKSKFALRLLDHDTAEFLKDKKNPAGSEVYAMTPYQTQDDNEEGGDQTPDDVSGGDDDQNEPGEPQDNNDGDSGEQNDETQDGNDQDGDGDNDDTGEGDEIDSDDGEGEDGFHEPEEKEPVAVAGGSVLDGIKQMYQFDNPKKTFKTISNFMDTMNNITDKELSSVVLPNLGLDPNKVSKQDFLDLVRKDVTPYFIK